MFKQTMHVNSEKPLRKFNSLTIEIKIEKVINNT